MNNAQRCEICGEHDLREVRDNGPGEECGHCNWSRGIYDAERDEVLKIWVDHGVGD